MYVPSYLFMKRGMLVYNEQMKDWQKLFPFVFEHGDTEDAEYLRVTPCPCVSVVFIH